MRSRTRSSSTRRSTRRMHTPRPESCTHNRPTLLRLPSEIGVSMEEKEIRFPGEDGRLVDLTTAALTDPNVHTDTRMRLGREITMLLASARLELHGTAGDHGDATGVTDDRLVPEFLTAV